MITSCMFALYDLRLLMDKEKRLAKKGDILGIIGYFKEKEGDKCWV